MNKSTTAKAVRGAILSLLALAVVLSLFAQVTTPDVAEALTTSATTAKPNQKTGNSVIGGQPTRITWEAIVDEGEEIAELSLVFPEGSIATAETNAEATILKQEDPRQAATRIEVEQTYTISSEKMTVSFAEPIEAGMKIRIEIHGIAMPPEGGTYSLLGSYKDSEGAVHKIDKAYPLEVIADTPVETLIRWLGEQEWVAAWNSVLFLRIFLNPEVIVAAVPNLFFGWLRSIGLVALGFPLAIPIGLGFAFLRMAKIGILRFLASIYVNVIRGTPLFLQIYIAFFGLPLLGVNLPGYLLGIIVLAMNSSAYLAEIFRAGIQSIHKGQFEAASSLGMNAVQTMFFVIIPQTVRRVVPTATSEFILLFKDTALLAAVGVMEQMMYAKSMAATSGNMTSYVVAAGFYLLITLPLARVIAVYEKKLAASEGASPEALEKKKKGKGKLGKIGELFGIKPAPFDPLKQDAEAIAAPGQERHP